MIFKEPLASASGFFMRGLKARLPLFALKMISLGFGPRVWPYIALYQRVFAHLE